MGNTASKGTRALVVFVVLGAMLSVFAAPGRAQPEPELSAPIVGNNPLVPEGKYPAVAYLLVDYSNGKQGTCTGTLVGVDWVLTAAHCVASAGATQGSVVDAATVYVVLGAPDIGAMLAAPTLPPDAEVYKAAGWILPRDYVPGVIGSNDVALIKLPRPSKITPMAISTNPTVVTPTTNDGEIPVTVVGFGVFTCTSQPCTAMDRRMREGSTVIRSDAAAQQAAMGVITAAQLEANVYLMPTLPQQAATCSGDSGGPVLGTVNSTLVIVAMISYGFLSTAGGCEYTSPVNGAADLSSPKLASWIRQVLQPGEVRCNGRVPLIVGTSFSDTIFSADGDHALAGLDGDDRMVGIDGANSLCGGEGNDLLTPGSGNGFASGGAGNDILTGGPAADFLDGGSGNDVLHGGPGKDELLGGPGSDQLIGGPARDKLVGQAGKDKLVGQAGNDALKGGAGKDKLEGGSGKDKLEGGSGKDRLEGGSGKDRLEGGKGNDTLVGNGKDTVNGGKGNDKCSSGSKRPVRCER